MGANNIWKIVLSGVLQDQECLNVFFYRGNALTNPEAEDIADAFADQILPDILACLSSDYVVDTLTVNDILSEATPFTLPLADNGQIGPGESLPAHDAYSLSMGVGSNVTRPGSKRFPGVPESAQNDGVVTDSGVISALNSLATTLAFNLFDTSTGLVPWAAAVVVKRILDGDSYRLPTTVGEAVTNLIVDVVPHLLVSSQVSRKRRQ